MNAKRKSRSKSRIETYAKGWYLFGICALLIKALSIFNISRPVSVAVKWLTRLMEIEAGVSDETFGFLGSFYYAQSIDQLVRVLSAKTDDFRDL